MQIILHPETSQKAGFIDLRETLKTMDVDDTITLPSREYLPSTVRNNASLIGKALDRKFNVEAPYYSELVTVRRIF